MIKNFRYYLLSILLFFVAASKAAVTITFSAASQQTFLLNPPYVSGVINDPTDAASIIGIKLDVNENSIPIIATDYSITVTSSKTSVVNVSNVSVQKFNGYFIVKILPTGVGYSDIKLTLAKGSSTANVTVKYAASAASTTPTTTKFHTGISDASAAIALDTNYMIVGDDEINSLFIYDRKNSGLPIASFDYQNFLGLTDGSTGNYIEIDLEAGVKSPNISNRIYWMSSLGTAGSSNSVKANINRLFATNVTGTGATTNIATVGYYNNIRNKLIAWGDSKGYDFTSSAAAGHDSKTIDGFNVEGMCFAPNNNDLFIAFRSPLTPITNRTKALIAPILNFETWFNNASPTGSPTFGNSIELDLGGRGIRDIIRLSNGVYIIVAGNYDNLPLKGALFKWTGNAADTPTLINDFNISTLNAEAAVEIFENNVLAENKLEIISDNGSYEFYNDGTQAKDLSQNNYKKFRSDLFTTTNNVLPNNIIEFKGIEKDNTYQLYWKFSMKNIQQVVVEKASNDYIFKNIYTTNTINLTGNFTDKTIANCNTLYRLKLIDNDGKISYSNTIICKPNYNTAYSITPNPAKEFIQIKSTNNYTKQIEIVDTKGSVMLKTSFNDFEKRIDLKNLIAGEYFVKIKVENNVITKKVIVCK